MLLAFVSLAVLGLLALSQVSAASAEPLKLHPDNPHYFLFRGRPTILVTSGEHYGAVLNADFDYRKYLDTLQSCGLNHTRTFVGAYMEHPGAFKIARNVLAPAPGRLLCPWARSDEPGYANGGSKFDLSRWDPAYFARLTDFLRQASDRGIVVEVNLFCPFYGEEQWRLSPMNATNNINGLGDVTREQVYTLDQHGGLLPVQEAMVRKVVAELRDFDNLYYEIMNEPYIREVPDSWQRHISGVIADAEKPFPHRHLLSQNIANHKAQVTDPDPRVSILNFHYAFPPDTVTMNYQLNRVIGDNETGFSGTSDARYRMEGWAFLLAGGGLYNNLDYSFTVGHEDGTFEYPPEQPGGGTPTLRRQLGLLSRFLHSFDFVRMSPDLSILEGPLPQGVLAQALVEPGRQVALYLYRPERKEPGSPVELSLRLPVGTYSAEWVSPVSGEVLQRRELQHQAGSCKLLSPPFEDDLALRVLTDR